VEHYLALQEFLEILIALMEFISIHKIFDSIERMSAVTTLENINIIPYIQSVVCTKNFYKPLPPTEMAWKMSSLLANT